MISKQERDRILAEISAINEMLAELPEDDVMERTGLDGRLRELAELLQQEPEPDKLARADVYFGGAPVVSSRGIDAEFASNALGKYQDLVSALFASRKRGSLSAVARIPDRKHSRLHIVDIVRGSFGFELADIDNQESLLRSALAEDIAAASQMLAAASESDEAFDRIIVDFDDRVLSEARRFFEILKNNRATFRVVTGDLDLSFTHASVSAAFERTNMTMSTTDDETIEGRFLGAISLRRQFDMLSNEQQPIRGKVSRDLTEAEIIELNRQWTGLSCVAHVKATVIDRPGKVRQTSYALLRIEAPKAPLSGG